MLADSFVIATAEASNVPFSVRDVWMGLDCFVPRHNDSVAIDQAKVLDSVWGATGQHGEFGLSSNHSVASRDLYGVPIDRRMLSLFCCADYWDVESSWESSAGPSSPVVSSESSWVGVSSEASWVGVLVWVESCAFALIWQMTSNRTFAGDRSCNQMMNKARSGGSVANAGIWRLFCPVRSLTSCSDDSFIMSSRRGAAWLDVWNTLSGFSTTMFPIVLHLATNLRVLLSIGIPRIVWLNVHCRVSSTADFVSITMFLHWASFSKQTLPGSLASHSCITLLGLAL